MPNTNPQSNYASGLNRALRVDWRFCDVIVWLAPLALVLVVLCCSPNFDSSIHVRNSPLGSDFLQDWIGATIITSSDRALLYDAAYSEQLQHDSSVVGFSWPQAHYYPMVYPPFFYSLLRPLAAMPYQAALWFWMLLIGVGLGATIALIKNLEPTAKLWPFFLAAALLFAPLLTSINMAHKSVFLLLIFTATFAALQRKQHYSAGLIFGLIAFKPHFAILLATAMLIKRQWYFVFGAATTVSILLVSTFACGLDLCADYFQQVTAATRYTSHAGYRLHEAVNLNAVIQLLVGDGTRSNWMIGLFSILVIGAITLAWGGPLQTASNRFAVQYSLLIFALPLLSPHFYIYDLTIMLLPFLLVIASAKANASDWTFLQHPSLSNVDSVAFFAICAFFLASGFFATFAEATGIQLAAVLLLLLIGTSLLHLLRDSSGITSNGESSL